MTTTFPNYGQGVSIVVEERPLSIFDTNIAGQTDVNGIYHVILINHITHTRYAVARDNYMKFHELGRPLDEGEEAVFNGERVRCMTYSEECAWNEDRLMEHVDLWGNIAVDEPFDMEWYLEHCI